MVPLARSIPARPCRRGAIIALVLLGGLIAGGWQGWRWFKQRPQPRTVSVRAEAPGITPLKKIEKREWPTLEIRFGAPVAPLEVCGVS